MGFIDLKKAQDGDEIAWWSDSFFNSSRDFGPYFGAEGFSEVFDADVDAEVPHLHLYYYKGGGQKKTIEPHVDAIRTLVGGIKIKGIYKEPYNGDKLYFARQPILSTVNLDALSDPTKMAREFASQAREFAEQFASILPGPPN
jgi:hypothetical protein